MENTFAQLSQQDTPPEVCVIDMTVGCGEGGRMHKASVDEIYREFGLRVRQRRRDLGLGQADLATRLGLTRASISNLEAGRQRPLLHQVIGLAQILDTDLVRLVPSEVGESSFDSEQGRHEELMKRLIAAADKSI